MKKSAYWIKFGLLVVWFFVFISCSNTEERSKNNSVDSAQNINQTKFDTSRDQMNNSGYLLTFYATSLYEIKVSQEALSRATHQQVKQLGAFVIYTHNNINKQINNLAIKKQVSLPADLNQKQQDKVNLLLIEQGSDFDREYVREMIYDHKDLLVRLGQSAQSNDPDIIKWSDITLPMVQAMVDKATTCQSNLDSVRQK